MRIALRVVGLGVLAAGCGYLLWSGQGQAGEDKALAATIRQIAALEAKGNSQEAAAKALALAKKIEDVSDIMGLLRPRNKQGLGVGPAPGAIKPDGIEQMIMALARDGITPDKLTKYAKALEQMAYDSAAVMEVALAKPPEKDEGAKTRKLWLESAKQAHTAALELAKAVRSGNASEVRTVANRLNTGCNNCHAEFR